MPAAPSGGGGGGAPNRLNYRLDPVKWLYVTKKKKRKNEKNNMEKIIKTNIK